MTVVHRRPGHEAPTDGRHGPGAHPRSVGVGARPARATVAPGLSLQARPGRGGAAHRGAGSIREEANLNLGWLGFRILEGDLGRPSARGGGLSGGLLVGFRDLTRGTKRSLEFAVSLIII